MTSSNETLEKLKVEYEVIEIEKYVPTKLERTYLFKWFMRCVKGEELELPINALKKCIEKELDINLDLVEKDIKESLPYILITFITTWPGWQMIPEYRDGTMPLSTYFNKFNVFIRYKMNMQRSCFALALQASKKEMKEVKESDLRLSIRCPPEMLNTIGFTEFNDDVILTQNKPLLWKHLSTCELLNWPYIKVIYTSRDLSFSRESQPKYTRYLHLHDIDSVCNIKLIDKVTYENTLRGPNLSLATLQHYVKEMSEVITTKREVPYLEGDIICGILQQFCYDMQYINQSIKGEFDLCNFNLSLTPYIRNSKQHNGSFVKKSSVGYTEILVPSIELTITEQFRYGQEKYCKNMIFNDLELLKLVQANITQSPYFPKVHYQCTFCNIGFNQEHAREKIIMHFMQCHGMDSPVRCFKCKKLFDMRHLASCRWKHECPFFI